MMHQTLVGLAATHARGLVNQDLHAGNLLMRREGNYLCLLYTSPSPRD